MSKVVDLEEWKIKNNLMFQHIDYMEEEHRKSLSAELKFIGDEIDRAHRKEIKALKICFFSGVIAIISFIVGINASMSGS